MQMQIQDLSRFEDENYDSGSQAYSDEALVALVHQNCDFLLHANERALRLESESEATCDLMWKIAREYLSGKYERLVTSDEVGDTQSWRRIILKNGTVLSICAPQPTLKRTVRNLFGKA